ncbi:MAG: hypothetical protein GY854_20530, partial [Deltaproteobacteria bacterium]|nr:hypothetical protein [Deltaproteobacteria bacterium]
IEQLPEQLTRMSRTYQRPGLKRLMVEDDLGTTIVVQQQNGGSLLLIAGKGASLGAASMSASRLAAALEELNK